MQEELTLEEVCSYLGIDDTEDEFVKANLLRQMKVADLYLKGAIGENYPKNDVRANELALMLIADMYENRSIDEISTNARKLFNQMCLQIKLEMLRKN